MAQDDPADEAPLTKAEMEDALRRMHQAHSVLRSQDITDGDGKVRRVYDPITYEGLKNSELYRKIGDAGLADLIDAAHAEQQSKNRDSRFSIVTDTQGNLLEVQKGFAYSFFGNLGRRPTDDDTRYPAVIFHGKWKAGAPAEWNMEDHSLIFWKSRSDNFSFNEEDAASFVPNMPSDVVSLRVPGGQPIAGLPVQGENGEMAQLVSRPIMGAFDAFNGYNDLSAAAKASFGKRLQEIGDQSNGAVAVYDAQGKLANLLVGRLTRWGDIQMEEVVDIATGEITKLDEPVIYNGRSAQQAKDLFEAARAAHASRTPYLAVEAGAERLIGPIPLADFRGNESYHETYRALPENARKWLERPIEEAKRQGKTNAVLMTLDAENRFDKVFLGATTGSLLTVTHRFDCATGCRFAAKAPLAAAALDPNTDGLLAPQEKAKLFAALQPQMIAVKGGYVVEPMSKRQFKELRDAPGQSVPRAMADFIDKRDDHIRVIAVLDENKKPVRLFLGKADKEDNVEIFITADCRDGKAGWRDFRAEAIPHGRLSSKAAAALMEKSEKRAMAPPMDPVMRARAQAMDKDHQPKSKPDTGEALVAAPTPGLPGGRYIR